VRGRTKGYKGKPREISTRRFSRRRKSALLQKGKKPSGGEESTVVFVFLGRRRKGKVLHHLPGEEGKKC